MEISRVKVSGQKKRTPEEKANQKMQIQVVRVNGEDKPAESQNEEIRELEEQIGRQEQILGELREELRRKKAQADEVREELEAVSGSIDSMEADKTRLMGEAAALQEEIEQVTRRKEANDLRLREMREIERVSDRELIRIMEDIRERYTALIEKQGTAQIDLEKDIEQLSEMKVSEFVDAAKVKELEQKYAEVSGQMQALQRELSRLSLGAGQEGDKRTDRLNTEE